MGKSDRALLVGLLALLAALAPRTLAAWPTVLWVGAALTLITSWQRVARTLRVPARS